ncbi:MAG: CDP-alcohol phosphatidyltransferase family protein [Nannocystaceae bacterium]|nr:CDP-alcohol phosphatidyltransferase family protein [Nannocystaceae bacterium]
MASNQIHQAIVIATKTTTIGGRHGPVALVKVGGVTLLKRALLSLVNEGVNRFAVVVADYAVRDKVGCDPKIAALDVSWVLNAERPDEDGYSVFSAGAHMVGDFIVVPADRVFDPKIAKQLLQRRCDGVTLAVANSNVLEPLAFLGSLRFTGLAIGDRELLDTLAVREAKAQPMPLTPVLGELAVRNELAVVDVGMAYCQPVVDKRSRGKADALLIASLRKSVDGVVARHVNRVFSLAVTRLIKNTPIRPNHVTAFSLAVSLLAAYLAAQSTAAHPGGLVVGALLWQLASMLDGVDGELARLKFAGSKLGEWFDTLTDDIGKFAFFMGSGIGAAAVFGSQIWFGIIALAVTIQVGTSLTVYRKLLQTGSGSHYALTWDGESSGPKSLWNRMTGRLHFLSRRDSLVAIWLGLAIVGLLKLAIVLSLLVTVGVLLNEFFNPRQVRAGFVTSPQRKPTSTQPVRSAL